MCNAYSWHCGLPNVTLIWHGWWTSGRLWPRYRPLQRNADSGPPPPPRRVAAFRAQAIAVPAKPQAISVRRKTPAMQSSKPGASAERKHCRPRFERPWRPHPALDPPRCTDQPRQRHRLIPVAARRLRPQDAGGTLGNLSACIIALGTITVIRTSHQSSSLT